MQDRRTLKIPYLDGWRGLAIIVVLVAHFQFEYLMWLGAVGVQLFFVLSGYLMGGLLFIKEVPLKDFFARRATRVLPTFFVFVCLMAVYAATLQPEPYTVPPEEFLSTLAFARSYFPSTISINAGTWPIGHAWSLNVEEHSYVLLAAGALIARSLGRKSVSLIFLWLSVLAVMFFNLYYPGHPPAGATEWHRRSEAAALGLLASAAYNVTLSQPSFRWLKLHSSSATLLSLAAALLCYVAYEIQGKAGSPILKYTLAPLVLAFSLNHLAYAPTLFHKFLSSRVLCWFGKCSFSLYLWQQPFFYAHAKFSMDLFPAVLGALLCGTISFYFLEDPLRVYLNRKWGNRKNKNAPAQSAPLPEAR